jgi:hypothetical protein
MANFIIIKPLAPQRGKREKRVHRKSSATERQAAAYFALAAAISGVFA